MNKLERKIHLGVSLTSMPYSSLIKMLTVARGFSLAYKLLNLEKHELHVILNKLRETVELNIGKWMVVVILQIGANGTALSTLNPQWQKFFQNFHQCFQSHQSDLQ